jgi:hypothetical protein
MFGIDRHLQGLLYKLLFKAVNSCQLCLCMYKIVVVMKLFSRHILSQALSTVRLHHLACTCLRSSQNTQILSFSKELEGILYVTSSRVLRKLSC